MAPESLAGRKQAGVMEFAGEVCHSAVEVHSPHGMTGDLLLLTYGEMRLIVFVGAGPEGCWVFPAQVRLGIIIMGLPPTLLDKILAETQIAPFSGGAVQFH